MLGGHFALHLALGGSDALGAEYSPTEITETIHTIIASLSSKPQAVRGVLFDMRNAKPSSEEMTSILATLKDWQLFTVLWVDPGTRYGWFELANYVTVWLIGPRWPNFKVNEIRYQPAAQAESWPEPDLYEVNAATNAYLVVEKKAAMAKKVFAFVSNASRPWGLITGSAWTAKILYDGEKFKDA